MKSNKTIGRIAGVVFFINLIPYVISHMVILDNILYANKFLQEIFNSRFQIGLSVLMEFVSITAMVIFAVLLFPILRRHGNRLSIIYLGLRFVEFGVLIFSIIKLLSLAELSQNAIDYGQAEQSIVNVLADTMLAEWEWIGVIYMLVYVLHCFIFFYLLFISKLVPRFISLLGGIATLLALSNIINHLFDLNFGGFFLFAPMGIVELILAIWLVVNGLKEDSA